MSEIGAPRDTWADALNEAPAREPAKRWRNKWRATCVHYTVEHGYLTPGEEYWGWGVWPTKDVAESKALARLSLGDNKAEYLGAFPEDA